jgi:hypothetical protein
MRLSNPIKAVAVTAIIMAFSTRASGPDVRMQIEPLELQATFCMNRS